MNINIQTTTLSRLGAYVEYLFEEKDDREIEELALKPHPDPTSRYLNRPYELGELMHQTVSCGFWPP